MRKFHRWDWQNRYAKCSGLYVQGERGEQQPKGKCLRCRRFNQLTGTFTRCEPVFRSNSGPLDDFLIKVNGRFNWKEKRILVSD